MSPLGGGGGVLAYLLYYSSEILVHSFLTVFSIIRAIFIAIIIKFIYVSVIMYSIEFSPI